MSYVIRKIDEEEYPILEEFLYQAIFIPEGAESPPRNILKDPTLSLYIDEFGEKKDDYGFVALEGEKIIGAIWARIINDYGYVDDLTPSLAMSVYKNYRGCGVGTEVLKKMLDHLKGRDYEKVSLPVQKSNYAVDMYKAAGFMVLRENENDLVMVCRLKGNH